MRQGCVAKGTPVHYWWECNWCSHCGSMEFPQKIKNTIQQFHFWIFIQRQWKNLKRYSGIIVQLLSCVWLFATHGLQHSRSPCPLPSPEVCPSLCPLHGWCHPASSSSYTLFFFCPQSFPASRTFPMSLLFASGDQNTGASTWASLVAQSVKNLPAMWQTWVWSLGWEDPLERGMATYSNILAWRIPWIEDPGRLQSMGLQRVGHDWATLTF